MNYCNDNMKSKASIAFLIFSFFTLISCTSHITTKSTLISTIYETNQPELINSYVSVVQHLNHYSIIERTENTVIVKYDPPGVFMGSASVQSDFTIAQGITSNGEEITGIEITHTDITPLFSQDTSFSGADVMARIEASLMNYLEFKKIDFHQVQTSP